MAPRISFTMRPTAFGFSTDASNMPLTVQRVWTYSGSGKGSYSEATLASNVQVHGQANLNFGITTPSGKRVAAVGFQGALSLGIGECARIRYGKQKG